MLLVVEYYEERTERFRAMNLDAPDAWRNPPAPDGTFGQDATFRRAWVLCRIAERNKLPARHLIKYYEAQFDKPSKQKAAI